MSRKSFALAIAIILLLGGLVGATGFVLVRHVPHFYTRCDLPTGSDAKRLADEVDSELTNRIGDGVLNEKEWQVNFRETQLNAFLAEGLLGKYTLDSPFAEGVAPARQPGKRSYSYRLPLRIPSHQHGNFRGAAAVDGGTGSECAGSRIRFLARRRDTDSLAMASRKGRRGSATH